MRRAVFVLSLLCSAAATAAAEEVRGLYRAETIVTGTEEPERSRGFRIGLTDVLVKLSGDARIAGDARLKPLLATPARFIARFEYEDRQKHLPVRDEQGTRDRPHYLRMRFKPAEIDRALAALGRRKWPAERPVTTVWLGVRAANGAYILRDRGADGYGQRAVLTETARRRGVPIRLPGADLPLRGLSFADIAALDTHRPVKALPGTDVALIGVLSLADKGYWNITWRLVKAGRWRTWSLRGVTFDTALRNGIERTALLLSGNLPF